MERGREKKQVRKEVRCILLIHLPGEVPESEGVLDGAEWGAGSGGYGESSQALGGDFLTYLSRGFCSTANFVVW